MERMHVKHACACRSWSPKHCSNEEKEDLATPDLKYLAVPYLAGELAALGAATNMHERLASLQQSSLQYMRWVACSA